MTVTQHSVQVDSIVSNIKTIYRNAEKVFAGQSNKLETMSLPNLLTAYESSVCRKYHDKRKLKASGFNEFFSDLTSYGQLISLSATEGIDKKISFSKLFLPETITNDLADRITQALRNIEIPTAVCEGYYCLLQNREPPPTSHKKLNTLLKKIHDNVCSDDTVSTANKSLAGAYIPATPTLQPSDTSTPPRKKEFIQEIEKTLVDANDFVPIDEHPSELLTGDQENSAYIKVSIPKTAVKQRARMPLEITHEEEKLSIIHQLFAMEKRIFFYAAASLIVGIGFGILASNFSEKVRNQRLERLEVAATNHQDATPQNIPSPRMEYSENLAQLRQPKIAQRNNTEAAKNTPPQAIVPAIHNNSIKNNTNVVSRNTGGIDTTKLTAQITRDEEWDLTLMTISRNLLVERKLNAAYRVGEFISDDFSRFEILGDIATTYASAGKISTALAKVNSIKSDSRVLPERLNRVFILSRLSISQYQIGKSVRAQQTLEEAEALANGMVSQPEKSITLSHIAAAYAAIGSDDVSSSFYRQANTLLEKTHRLPERLSGNTAIALSYHRSGERNKAIKILHESLKGSETLSKPHQRTSLQAEIALALAKIGNANSALLTAQNINSTSVRNNTLYQIAVEQIGTGQLHAAKITVQQLELPEYQAKAYALLARFQKGTRFASQANGNFSRAVERGRAVLDPRIKAILLSEIARHHMRSKKQSMAEELMEESLSVAHKIDNPMIRDKALASIAKNQARAYLLPMAERTVDSIGNRPIALESLKDIQHIRRIIYALHAVDAPLNI